MFVGKVTNYFKKIDVAEITIETHSLSVGDEILVIGPTTGVYEDTLSEIRVNLKPVEKAVKKDVCSIPAREVLRRGDKVYKIVYADRNVPNLVQQ